jgi:hypothetical protein
LYLFFGGAIVLTMGALVAFVIEMLVAATVVRLIVDRSVDLRTDQPTIGGGSAASRRAG